MASPHRSPSPPPSNQEVVIRLKRRIAALEQEVHMANGQCPKKKSSAVSLGWGIRRLVTLFEPLDDLLSEADRRSSEEPSDAAAANKEEEEEQLNLDRLYRGYNLMLQQVPSLRSLLEDDQAEVEDLDRLVSQLQKGANDARSDDLRRIKEELANWLNEGFVPSVPFSMKSRGNRGLHNDITGQLLCPIEYDWSDEGTRACIRDGTINISDELFLYCLYPFGKAHSSNVEKGFLCSRLLVKTYCAIFTSPTSLEEFEQDESEDGPSRKKVKMSASKKATKSNVATILHMSGRVTPRSIAYAAVMLAFNLTDATQWSETYNGFNFRVLWHFIIDYFEDSPDEISTQRAASLLKWWNRKVFPDQVIAGVDSQKARKKLAAQRALRRV
ncbi:hypothetical protein BJ165DRAFT_1535541 [Panaeolus papilionaceus]|nr:hypothetical protein BJ165DRAFT_1535541 [Panaeolus papilionaceus]